MSKSIRIRDHLYEEIQARAEHENRPLIRQLEMLLEQALALQPKITDQPEVEIEKALKEVGRPIEVRPVPPPAVPLRNDIEVKTFFKGDKK